MKEEEHITALREHIRKLKEGIEEGLTESQRNIAYNASQGSVELFSIYMHHLRLASAGEEWDHRTFKSNESIRARIPEEFPKRAEILKLMRTIEEGRLILCYGKRKPEERIAEVIRTFQKLKKTVFEEAGELDEKE